MGTTYKIHPAIGVMRVGDSDQYYLAPETAGGLPLDPNTNQPTSDFRDASGRLKKQAARFKVFAYDTNDPTNVRQLQVGQDNLTHIEWTVWVANKKAVWFQFKQLTGSGQEVPGPHEPLPGGYEDQGYLQNNVLHNQYGNQYPSNPLRNEPITDVNARQNLILDPGPRTIGGPTSTTPFASFDLPQDAPTRGVGPFEITSLGGMQQDSEGNLHVVGGSGNSCFNSSLHSGYPSQPQIIDYANNNGWFDDTSDGPVTAKLYFAGQSEPVEVDVPAWVTCAPPKFAPEIINQVTMWDNMYDIFVRHFNYQPNIYSNGNFNAQYQIQDVATQILPVLQRPTLYQWVMDMPQQGINEHNGVEYSASTNEPGQFPSEYLRAVDQVNDPGFMPKLCGDNPFGEFTKSRYLSLTATQVFLLSQWKLGRIAQGGSQPPLGPGEALDKAYLDNCVGGPFTPGIEITWISRNPNIYASPFRIKQKQGMVHGQLSQTNGDDNLYLDGLEPGDLCKYMAQPWQADYNECSIQPITRYGGTSAVNIWWWPAQRPWFVFPQATSYEQVPWTRGFVKDPPSGTTAPSDLQMVTNWKDLGFVLKQGTQYLEVDRNTAAIQQYSNNHPTGAGVMADDTSPTAAAAAVRKKVEN